MFVLAPLSVPIYLISDLKTAVAFVFYSFIGIGEIMVFLGPFFEGRITQKGSRYIFLLSFMSVLSVLSYALFPTLRFGVDNLMVGYYGLALSFLLIFISAIIRLAVNNKKTSVENN